MHTFTLSFRSSKVFLISGFIFISVLAMTSKINAAGPCKLSFSFQGVPASAESGAAISRTILVKNIGSTACRSVSFSLFYGKNEQFVSSSPNPAASNYYWYIGTLKSGKRASVTITTKHDPLAGGVQVSTEGCAAGTGAMDACAALIVKISQAQTPSVQVSVDPVTPSLSPTALIATSSEPSSRVNAQEKGMWIWNFPGDMLSVAADAQLRTLSSYGFNAVYITIDDYIDIAVMPEGTAKDAAKKTYFDNLAKFVSKANGYGMKVDVEGGAKEWAKPANRWKGFALIDAAKEYNASYPNQKLRGFQYDVEPYLLPEYETNKAAVLLDFVTFIDQSVERLGTSDIVFSASIPHFYDSVVSWTPSFVYNGTDAYPFTHLLKILEKKPGSSLLLMSYRDTFEGTNGTRAISESEVKEVSTGYHTRVIVGQETGNVDPSYVTYFRESRSTVLGAADTINSAFKGYAQFGGVAIHYLDSFLAMGNE